MDDLLTLRFVHNAENVVFLGPPGVGKTHLSVAIGMQAAYSEISICYIPAVRLVQVLRKDFLASRLTYRLAAYSRFPLMIVDEIGCPP
jgi:DNA replication protein DnaC